MVTLWYRPPEILLGCKTYALPVDVWAIGTMLAEMVTKRPLFPGDSEIDEIFKIFRILGTPNEEVWPGCTALPDWNEDFPVWPSLHISRFTPGLCENGVDLLEVRRRTSVVRVLPTCIATCDTYYRLYLYYLSCLCTSPSCLY